MSATVSGLKVLKSYIYADVLVGYTANQRVTTTVRINTADEQVAEAMRPLLDLLAERAQDMIRTADVAEQIDAGVRAELKVVADNERARLGREHGHALRLVEKYLGEAKGHAKDDPRTTIALDRATTALRGITGRE